MIDVLNDVIDGKEIHLTTLWRSNVKWLMIELFDRGINFKVINGILKRE